MSYAEKYIKYKKKYILSKNTKQFGGELGDIYNTDVADNTVLVFDKIDGSHDWTDEKNLFKYTKINQERLSEILKSGSKLIGFYYGNQYYDDPIMLKEINIYDDTTGIKDKIHDILKGDKFDAYRYVIDNNDGSTQILHKGTIYYDTVLYTKAIDKKVHPLNTNTYDLVVKLYGEKYEKLNRTQVIVFKDYKAKESKKSEEAKSTATLVSEKLKLKLLSEGGYEFHKNHAYVNFANKRIGGDVFKGAFVQEEMITTFSNLYHLINKIDFTKNNILNNLDNEPALLKMAMLYSQKTNRGYNEIKNVSKDPDEYLNNHTNAPIDIFYICMAAKSIAKNQPLDEATIIKYFNLASSAFDRAVYYMRCIDTDKDGDKTVNIHTGNWARGVYSNNVNTMYLIQYLAIRHVSQSYTDVNINYNHYCFVKGVHTSICENAVRFFEKVKTRTTKEILDLIIKNTDQCKAMTNATGPPVAYSDEYFDGHGGLVNDNADANNYWYKNWICHVGTT